MALNPAFAGMRGNFGVTGLLGQQFNGTIYPNQVSQVVVLDGKMGQNQRSAIGFQGFRSTVTGFTNNGLSLSYAQYIEVSESIQVNAGLNFGFMVAPNVIGTQDFTQRFVPFGGPGVTVVGPAFFAGIAAPTVIGKSDQFSAPNKNLNIQGGYKLGNDDNIAANVSFYAGFPLDARSHTFTGFSAKVWLGSKIGLGASWRSLYAAETASKLIPSLELRVSESSTVGLSYDGKPLLFEGINDSFRNPNGVFQLVYRYDVFNFGEKSPFLNQF